MALDIIKSYRAATHFLQVQNWARMWRIIPKYGAEEYYTDHDADVTAHFHGENATHTFDSSAGVSRSASRKESGSRSGNITLFAPIGSFDKTKIEGGYYDLAAVYEYRADTRWPDFVWSSRGIYWVTRASTSPEGWSFDCEDVSRRMNEVHGEPFCRSCRFTLGKDRLGETGKGCGQDRSSDPGGTLIDIADFTYTGAVVRAVAHEPGTSSRATFAIDMTTTTPAFGPFLSRDFEYGRVTWTTGNNAGQSHDIRDYNLGYRTSLTIESGQFSLSDPTIFDIEVGDVCTIEEGCDGSWETCGNRFGNRQNFGAAPLMSSVVLGNQSPRNKWY